ncbi:non-ribosomal peptide synthetase [Salinispora pacifica]|uniref:non-ribosomal peptide synthetase n=1 Tax=Salinispora pacifica TaxID=351187 RepID=UPI00048A1B55|nr:non-ribosomal peptide synthetase [Salinispora pacifica]
MSAEAIRPPQGAGARLLRDRLRARASDPTPDGDRLPDVVAVPRDGVLPLSFAQRRLWVLDRIRPGGVDYVVPIALRLDGDLSRLDLGDALRRLVARHEILRTRYVEGADGEPVQRIDPPGPVPLEFVDLGGAPESALDSLLEAEALRPFDLANGPVLRARLIRSGPRTHVLAVLLHHIAIDGWSCDLLVRDLAALCAGADPQPPALQYADFAAWQRAHPADPDGVAYWTRQLRDLPAPELPTDRPRPAVWDDTGGTVRFDVPADLARRAGVVAREHRATPFMLHLAVLWTLLARCTGQTDFAVSTPIAGRTRRQTHDLIGHFVNMLVLRADLAGDPTFAELLDRARSTAIDAYSHQEVPFEQIVDALAVDRDLATHPLTGVNLTLQNNEPARFEAAGVTGELVPVRSRRAKFDLGWTLEERPDGSFGGEVTYPHALFDEPTIHRMTRIYRRLLEEAVADPGRPVGALPMLDGPALAEVVRPPAGATPAGPCLHERFGEQARRRGDAVALIAGADRLTYRELDERANRLAHRLRGAGVGREHLVGICLPRGLDLVVAVLGVLKAGAAYLPLDPDHPQERLGFLLRDADAHVLVTDRALATRAPTEPDDEVIVLDDPAEAARIAALPGDPPPAPAHPDDLAYVIYTSGSTGQPKGVQVTHGNVVRLLTGTEQEYRFGPDDVWALFHSYAFDVSVWEIWGALLYGGRLVVVPYPVSRSPWELADLLAAERVTVLNQTQSAFRSLVQLAERGEGDLDRLRLRLVILAGEAVDVESLRPWWQRFGDETPRLVNMYGITETTVHSTYRALTVADLDRRRSPIGRPLTDLTVHLLDDRLQPVPLGVPGEICVGGPGVTRGYLNRPALTARRYVPDPYGAPGARLYRSGDKARMVPGGELEFLGRFDDQVKIRGFRVELGEVEACLGAHPDLKAAVVTVQETGPGEHRLVGYLVPRTDTVTVPQVRTHLSQRLPAYMVPAVLTVLPELPLTVNGKVDRRALPAPDEARPEQRQEYRPPATAAEMAMAGLWAQVLGVDLVGVRDNFFALGGDSIRAVRLVGLLRDRGFGYSVQDLFRHQSIAELLAGGPGQHAAERVGTPPFALLVPYDRARMPEGVVDAYPMARAQAGMVYELLADPENRPYQNVTSYLVRDTGDFDPAALRAAVDGAVAAHEILRTSFDLAGFAEPVQLVHRAATPECAHHDLRGMPADEQRAQLDRFRRRERVRVFDLGRAPLIRVHAHRVTDKRWYLSLTECHAILDGWSHNSLVSELLAGYRAHRAGHAPPTPETTAVRFADFVAQERHSVTDPADRGFWAGRLAGVERLTIPAAWGDPAATGTCAVHVPYRDVEEGLRELATRAGASLKSVLLAAHLTVWRQATGATAFHGALVSNGRTEAQGGDLVRGMFLNPVPVVAPPATGSWRDLVRAVFAEEVALWPHRRYPLAEMQRLFGAGGRLHEVAFNYLDFHVLDRVTVDTEASTDVSPNEFPFAVSTLGGALVMMAQAARIDRRHCDLLAGMYRAALTAMATDPDGPATRALLPAAARERLLSAGAGPTMPVAVRGLHQLVAEQADERPYTVAVRTADDRLTYRDLRSRARTWAARLRAAGVRPGDRVGVCLPREPELLAAIAGIAAAGAAWVPVDRRDPLPRVTAVLADADVRAVVAGPEHVGRHGGRPVLTPDPDARRDDGAPLRQPHPDDVAYVVHTSGSTGRPMGVVATHGALADRAAAMRRNLRLTATDVVLGVVPVSTDVAQLALAVTLGCGGQLVLASEDDARDPVSLADLLRRTGATVMQASPTTWRMLLESGWTPPAGFRVLSGGEAVDAGLVRRLAADGAEVWDNYGPSEATVFCFGSRLSGPDAPVWTPAANTTVHLLDDDLTPVLPGVPGQIFVGGDGLAQGYLGRPRATAGAFLPDPYAATPGARLYATGDIGRWDQDGRIVVLGRRDHQVKIRGFRIELGEVEHVLLTQPGVRGAVVHPVAGGDGNRRLAAYLVLDAGGTAAEVRRRAGAVLPDHMVPATFTVLPAFPRLPNGKIDRGALPAPAPDETAPALPYRAPRGPVEQAIAATWADLLDRGRAGRDDDFFAIGGHSLLMLRVIARLRRVDGIDLSFRDFLTHRTVRGIAAAAGAPDRSPASALLWLRRDGAGTPLFCLHPGGGSAHWYRELAAVAEQPVAAFEWPGLHDGTVAATDVPAIAGHYLDELRAARPSGPYHLLGWCASSGIAWEMARRLRADGERVRLILLDPVNDDAAADREAHRARVGARLARLRDAERVCAAVADEGADPARRADLLATIRELVDDADAWVDDADLGDVWAHRLRAWRHLLQARLDYRFPTYAGSVDVLLSDEVAAGDHESALDLRPAEYVRRWRGAAAGDVRVHRVAGDHLGVLRPPRVAALAAVLAAVTGDTTTDGGRK